MTRAEEKAREYEDSLDYYHYTSDPPSVAYKAAYEQAKEDTIEKAIAWLEKHADDYIVDLTPTYPDAPQQLTIGGKCWEHLKKAIEEEL